MLEREGSRVTKQMEVTSERMKQAQQLRAEGKSWREVGEALGVNDRQAARLASYEPRERECPGCGEDLTWTHPNTRWCSDKCRKDTLYAGECENCGAKTGGSNGRGPNASKRCRYCSATKYAERNEELIEMWEAGEPTRHIAEKLEMSEEGVRRTANNLRRRHGRDLPLRRLRNRELWDEILKLKRRKLTYLGIAEELGISRDRVNSMIVTMRKKGIAT